MVNRHCPSAQLVFVEAFAPVVGVDDTELDRSYTVPVVGEEHTVVVADNSVVVADNSVVVVDNSVVVVGTAVVGEEHTAVVAVAVAVELLLLGQREPLNAQGRFP